MIRKLFAIIANTFVETIRQPIFGVLMWAAAGLLILNPSIAAYSLESGKDNKIMQDVGLSALLLYGLLVSVFSATGVITREIESYTVLTVVSKPVSRPLFIFGKYLGVAAAILVGYYFLCLVFFMTVRHGVMETATDKYDQPVLLLSTLAILISLVAATFGNYVYGWHFSTALTAWVVPLGTVALLAVLFLGPQWQPQSPATDFGDLQIAYAVALIFLAVLILTAFAVALSTRFSQVLTLLLCVGVFVLGLLSDYYLGRFVDEGPLYRVLYAILPNFQFFWVGDALTQEMIIPGAQVARVAAYTGLYALAVLSLGVALFQTREVG
jgi:ABC-type transport system involved in multi-copper enzyme maturation permease subunit